MSVSTWDWFGYIASTITAIQCIPQLYKTIKEKDVSGVSPWFVFFVALSSAFWCIWGIQFMISNEWSNALCVFVPNVISVVASISVLIAYFKYKEPVSGTYHEIV